MPASSRRFRLLRGFNENGDRRLTMADFAELDKLSTDELHHRAVRAAEHHLDIGFFWKLAEYIPMAEVVAGSPGEGDVEIEHISIWFKDFVLRGGKLDEALRPVYIDYLEHHSEPSDH
jgi:hypothetical protein